MARRINHALKLAGSTAQGNPYYFEQDAATTICAVRHRPVATDAGPAPTVRSRRHTALAGRPASVGRGADDDAHGPWRRLMTHRDRAMIDPAVPASPSRA